MNREFGTLLPKKIELKNNDSRLIACNELNDSKIYLGEKSHLILVAVLKKGWKHQRIVNFFLNHPFARVDFLALVIGFLDNQFKFSVIANHFAPNTKSSMIIKSALSENSEIHAKGGIIISETGKKSDAYFSHSTLALSENIKVQTLPYLEIKTNDVCASHSASVGKVNEEMLFYLASRGIDKKSAEKLLIKGFLEEELKKINDETAREMIEEEIENILNSHDA